MRGVRRKQQLRHRVAGMGGSLAAAHAGMTPLGGGGAASPPAPQVMPLSRVTIAQAQQPDYVTIRYAGIAPIWAPDGETIPAAPNGTWGQIIPAGRP